jgi:hypothetical protein
VQFAYLEKTISLSKRPLPNAQISGKSGVSVITSPANLAKHDEK